MCSVCIDESKSSLRQERNPAENVLAKVPHRAAGEGGVGVDVLIVVEPLRQLDLKSKSEIGSLFLKIE